MTASNRVEHRVGFVGTGRMATALAHGLASSGFAKTKNIIGNDVLPQSLEQFAAETGGQAAESNGGVFASSEIVFLAVKPQQMANLLTDVKQHATPAHLIVSIAAGITLKTLTDSLGADRRIIRVMPNTPCLIGAGASGFAGGGSATVTDRELVEEMLSTVGIAIEVPEKLLDAVTGLSGSGPAFAFQTIEALSDGGVRVGLPRDIAMRLAAQTLLGAAQMVVQTGEHPAVLKDAVASPGGTTIAGLRALEQGGLHGCLIDAVEAATARSKELGESS